MDDDVTCGGGRGRSWRSGQAGGHRDGLAATTSLAARLARGFAMVEQDDDPTVFRGRITHGGKILMTDRPPDEQDRAGDGGEPTEVRKVGDRSIGEARRDNTKIEAMFSLKQFPDGHTNQARYCRNIREMGREFALIISENTPGCADQTLAIRHVRQAVLWAQEAVLREGLV